jgi:hypothetical protein
MLAGSAVFDDRDNITAKMGPVKMILHKVNCLISTKVTSNATEVELKDHKFTKGRLGEAQPRAFEQVTIRYAEIIGTCMRLGAQLEVQGAKVWIILVGGRQVDKARNLYC